MGDEGDGSACYFPRDLSRGSFGGDVNCLQQYLQKQGYLKDKPSGFFGAATEQALVKWQTSMGITPALGFYGPTSRLRYAKLHGLPTAEEQRGKEKKLEADGVAKKCIDVCSQFKGKEVCQTRCVRNDSELYHACREACQVAYSSACDQAYPTGTGAEAEEYKVCLAALDKSCRRTCSQYEKK